MRRMKYLLFLLVLLCSFYNVFAEEKTITINSVVLQDISENTVENDSPIIDDSQINYDLIFHDTGDSITYNIKMKNNSDTHYIINQVFDNNSNDVVKYEYIIPDNDFDKGEKQTIQMRITYNDEIPSDSVLENSIYHLNDNVTISVDLIEYNLYYILNPRTNPNILFFYIIFVVLIAFGITMVKKKKIALSIVALLIAITTYNVMAKDMETVELTVNNKVEIPIHFISHYWYNKVSNNYTKFVVSKGVEIPGDAVDISEKEDGSIKGWIDDDTLYMGSKYRMYLPSDASNFFNYSHSITNLDFKKDSISSKFAQNFSYMFYNLPQLEELDTSWINTDNATSLYYMFRDCSKIKKLDLSDFYNPSVSDLCYHLISGCSSLEELDLSNWKNSSSITSITFRYLPSTLKKINVDNFDTSHLTNANYMFSYCQCNDLVLDLTTWDFSGVTGMGYMFSNSKYNEVKMPGGEFSNLTNVQYMFYYSTIDKIDFEESTCPLLVSAQYMFCYSTYIGSLNIGKFDFSHVTNMYDLFYNGTYGEIILDGIDTSSAENMGCVFGNIKGIEKLDLSDWDFDSAKNMYGFFYYSELKEVKIGNVNSPNLQSIDSMFYNTPYLEKIDWGTFDTSSVTSADSMFGNSGIIKLDLSPLDFSNIKNFSNFLLGSNNLVEIITPISISLDSIVLMGDFVDPSDNVYIVIDSNTPSAIKLTLVEKHAVLVTGSVFNQKLKRLAGNSSAYSSSDDLAIKRIERSYTSPDLSQMNDANIISTDNDYPVYAWFNNGTIYYYCENAIIYANPSSSYMFQSMMKLEYIDLSTISTSKVTTMYYMFFYTGYSATSFEIDVSHFDTSKVKTMFAMFYNVGNLSETWSIGDLSNWNTSHVTNMGYMFSEAGSSSTSTWSIGDLSGWDVSHVTNMSCMFQSAIDGSLIQKATVWSVGDLSNWDVSNVTTMDFMFAGSGYAASEWSVGDLSNWNVSKVSDMEAMFSYAGYNASSVSTGDLSGWDVSKVTTFRRLFHSFGFNSTSYYIGELTNWNVSSATDMYAMFADLGRNASSFSVGDLSNWNVSKVTNFAATFYRTGQYAISWSVGNLSGWNVSNATSLSSMFDRAGESATNVNIGSLSSWSTSKVTDMSYLFNKFGAATESWSIGDLSNWNVSNVTDMNHMFNRAGFSSTTFNIGSLSNWNTSKVTNMNYMFSETGKVATTWNSIGTLKIYASTVNGMFSETPTIKAALKIYNNPTTYIDNSNNMGIFSYAATTEDSLVTVDYTSNVTSIDDLIATQPENGHVVKGSIFS